MPVSQAKRAQNCTVRALLKLEGRLRQCPLKADEDSPCDKCRFVKDGSDLQFHCHCGAPGIKLPRGGIRRAHVHWKSLGCVRNTSRMRGLGDPGSGGLPDTDGAQQTYQVVCLGLNDLTWKRRGDQPISVCIESSPTPYHGFPPRWQVCEQMFNTASENGLSEDQRLLLESTLESKATWVIKRHSNMSAIHSVSCLRTVSSVLPDERWVCSPCLEAKSIPSLVQALNCGHATSQTIKYINKRYEVGDQFQPMLRRYSENRLLNQSLEQSTRAGDREFWEMLACHGKAGIFDDLPVFIGLAKSVSVRAEREANGSSLRGMRLDTYWDNLLTTVGAYSRGALELVTRNLAGRTVRGQRLIRQHNGSQLLDGLAAANFVPVCDWVSQIGYLGPLAGGTDQTVCVKALRYHNGYVVGAQGGDIKFTNVVHLEATIKGIVDQGLLCDKIRAYTVQIPMPNCPTFVVALIASRSDEKSEDILRQNMLFIQMMQDAGLPLLSLGSDGAASELAAQSALNRSARSFLEYHNPRHGVIIRVPLLGSLNRPIVSVQDPKHARKTAANQILSGARVLSFGCYHVDIKQLLDLLDVKGCPLTRKDVLNTDRQDDTRAYKTFCPETFECATFERENLGLAIYLFVLGELTDAWLSHSMPHRDRISSVWSAVFFLKSWHEYLLVRQAEPEKRMNVNQNGISHQSLKIFIQLGESLIGLILSHRDYYPDSPLCTWKHGTEACEHIFGWMRIISPNFTVLDARQMIPKIFAVVKSIMSGKIVVPSSDNVRSGYQYFFSEESLTDCNPALQVFPSNAQIDSALDLARARADSLAACVGLPSGTITQDKEPSLSNDVESFEHHEWDSHIDPSISISLNKTTGSQPECANTNLHISHAIRTNTNSDGADDPNLGPGRPSMEDGTNGIIRQLTTSMEQATYEVPPGCLDPRLGRSMDQSSLLANQTVPPFEGGLVTMGINIAELVHVRQAHNSQVRRGKGTERVRIQATELPTGSTLDSATISPSDCSKIVSCYWRASQYEVGGADRLNRWRIPLRSRPVISADVRNSAMLIELEQRFREGEISEENVLEHDKWVIVIRNGHLNLAKVLAVHEDKNGKHAWVQSSCNAKKISYVSVLITTYVPGEKLTNAALNSKRPGEYTFSLIRGSMIAYVYLPSPSDSFVQNAPGSYYIPDKLLHMLQSIDIPMWINSFEAHRSSKAGQRLGPQ